MELMVLPILALLGLVLLVDFGGGDTEPPEPPEPNPDLNRVEFGETDDTTTGSDVVDYLFMNGGDDMASGGEGDDSIFFGAGQDQSVELNEDGSFDTAGMEGNDRIRGGEGRDILVDALGSNTIYGDIGYDRINTVDDASSPDTPDTVFGGFGNDAIFADGGDVISGGEGEDRFQLLTDADGAAVTVTDYEEGDTFLLRDPDGNLIIRERITIGLSENGEDSTLLVDDEVVAVLQGVTEVDPDSISNFVARPYFGTPEDDDIEIGEFGTRVVSFEGDDDIRFANGIEARGMTIQSGTGDDTIVLGDGDDFVEASLGADTIIGGGGTDEIYAGYGDDIINSASETIALDAADTVFGGAGNDEFYGDNGDALIGGTGTDEFVVNLSNPAAAAVTVGDFDPATEQLVGEVNISQDATPTVTYEVAEGGIGTNVVVEGRVAIILIGVDPSALNAGNVTIYNTNVSG